MGWRMQTETGFAAGARDRKVRDDLARKGPDSVRGRPATGWMDSLLRNAEPAASSACPAASRRARDD